MASLPGEREPRRLPVLPLRDVVVFPHVAMPLLVGRAGSLGAIEAASAARRLTALMESLGQQLTIALISAADARRLMEEALVIELDPPPAAPSGLGAGAVSS